MNLPTGWRLARLGDLCVRPTDIADPTAAPGNSFRYVDISSVDNRAKRITGARKLLGKDAPSRARKLIRADDVIVATTRPNLNAVAKVPSELDGQVCSTGFCVLRSGPELVPDFLFAFVQSSQFIDPLSGLVQGALYPAVNDDDVFRRQMALPPLVEQQRIAAVLRDQLAAVERARVAAEARLEAASALPRSCVSTVFDSPESVRWPMCRLIDICEGSGQYGSSVRSNGQEQGLPILGMYQIHEGRIRWENVVHVELSQRAQSKYLLRPGDLLFNRTNSAELVGKTAVFDSQRPAVFASYLIRFRMRKAVADPRFVSFYINSLKGRRFIERKMARAIGQVNISASVMHEMPIPIPDLSVQATLCDWLDSKIESSTTVRELLTHEEAAINRLPTAMLQQAFEGKL